MNRSERGSGSAGPNGRPIGKHDVIGPLDWEKERLHSLVRDLGEERASEPIVDGWSARDVLAHCIYWTGMLARMMGVGQLPPPSWIPRWQSEHEVGTDELNRLTVEHYRPIAFETVLADFRFTGDVVKSVIDWMKEENLTLPAGEPWGQGTQVWQAIAGETYDHWREHADELEKALGPHDAGSSSAGTRPSGRA